MENWPKSETNHSDSSRSPPTPSKLQKSEESVKIYTKCVNDDSDGSVLSNWMDSDVEETSSPQISKINEIVKKTSEYLMKETEKENVEIREVNSEYAFDIQNY